MTDTVHAYSMVGNKSGDAADYVVAYNLSNTLYDEESPIVSDNASSVLSKGSVTIIAVIGAVAVIGVAALVIAKKKKPALAEGAENKGKK